MNIIILSSIIQWGIIGYSIYQIYINHYEKQEKYKMNTLFNYLIIPLMIYYSIGHLVFPSKVSQSIGWKSSPYQFELGLFTLSITIISLIVSKINSYEVDVSISYIWLLFFIFASINHIKHIIKSKNYSFNNIQPISITIIMGYLIIDNSRLFLTNIVK